MGRCIECLFALRYFSYHHHLRNKICTTFYCGIWTPHRYAMPHNIIGNYDILGVFYNCQVGMTWFYKFRLSKKTESDAPCRILHILYVDAHIFVKFLVRTEVCGWKYMHRTLKASGAPRDRNARVACSTVPDVTCLSLRMRMWLGCLARMRSTVRDRQLDVHRSSDVECTDGLGRVVWVAISSWRQGMRERVLLSVQKHSYSITEISFRLL